MTTATNRETFTKQWNGGGGHTVFTVISEVSVSVEDFGTDGSSLGYPQNMLKEQARRRWLSI